MIEFKEFGIIRRKKASKNIAGRDRLPFSFDLRNASLLGIEYLESGAGRGSSCFDAKFGK